MSRSKRDTAIQQEEISDRNRYFSSDIPFLFSENSYPRDIFSRNRYFPSDIAFLSSRYRYVSRSDF